MTPAKSKLAACAIGLAIAGNCFGNGSALAQDGATRDVNERLERIEQKLDRILDHLGLEGERQGVAAGMTILPSVEADASDIPPPPGVADPEPYKAGAIAIARPAPEKQSALDEIPADSVGSFVYTGGAIPLNELSRNGVRYPGLAAVELQAWLKVTQPGRTQIGVEYRATTGTSILFDPTCVASMWLEDRSIGSQREKIPITARGEKTILLVFGADLQPGLYRLRVWSACTPARDLRGLNAELLIKTPDDMNLRAVTGTDLLHQGG